MKKRLITLILCTVIPVFAFSQVVNNWRGTLRDGVYNEKGLLKTWPEGGPEMLWLYEELGSGFTSPAIVDGKIYISGTDDDGTGYIHIIDLNGKLIKKIEYGPEYTVSYPGSRTSPLIDGNLAYMTSGNGIVYCIDLLAGKVKWKKDYFNEFDGKNLRFGFTEGLIIDGDKLYCTPGGPKYNIVALNKNNGDIIWASEGKGTLSAYCSPLLFTHNGKKMLVTMMSDYIVAVNPDNGKLLWSHPYKNDRNIHPNAPIYHDGSLYCFSGYGKGGVMVKINPDGNSVTETWATTAMDSQIGSAILVNGKLYGSGDRNRKWFCLDWATGNTLGELEFTELGKGNIIFSDGRLFIYTEPGELSMAEPLDNGIKITGKTKITHGTEQHWAHPVILNGVIYVRHGDAFMAFKIK